MQLKNGIIMTDDAPLGDIHKGGLGQFCFEFMKKHRTQLAEIDAQTGQEETYDSLLKKCIRTSIMMENKGIQKGDMVVVYSKVQLCSSVPLISSFFIGAVPTFLDDALTYPEILNILKQINPKLILTTSEMLKTVQTFIESEVIRINSEIVVFDEEFYKEHENESEFKPTYVNDLKETAVIPFSSGSTGFPKGICLSHYTLLRHNLLDYDKLWFKDKTKVLLSYYSFHWSIEIERLICSIRDGICYLVDPKPFEASRAWHLLEMYKVCI